ncbi:hypothetical protein EVAR_54142_1 [Eumeta japonica]|uniref:Uncharacterized protein n=1 Tax=Eumeta variegata TaxID=151549 RepID=A0A4C1YY02_EUMVA|nr:hypothetical protein EVAR_54142_1 [Eumeta japonica]
MFRVHQRVDRRTPPLKLFNRPIPLITEVWCFGVNAGISPTHRPGLTDYHSAPQSLVQTILQINSKPPHAIDSCDYVIQYEALA